ncbi:MAG: winged helix-turn-helix transcriptional regulator [Deltaproteobacteria bacterium]|nr:winged helix-turn-helix transcriptional regulator [Deltaproteobacteria bacterium]
MNIRQQKILSLLAKNPKMTVVNIADAINLNRAQSESSIRQLKKLGFIEHRGSRRYGRWVLKNQHDNLESYSRPVKHDNADS